MNEVYHICEEKQGGGEGERGGGEGGEKGGERGGEKGRERGGGGGCFGQGILMRRLIGGFL